MPNNFEEETDARYFITMAFCKDKIWNRINAKNLREYDRCYVAIETTQNVNKAFSVLGVHIPAETNKNKEKVENFISKIGESKYDIICGDFNASYKKPESINYTILKELTKQKKYSNLWEQGLKEDKAYYIDYKGTKQKANNNIRTFVGNTHIDYILGKEIDLTEITIDMRTLAFTDHCAIIVNCEKNNTYK
ncbi:endonuclease/exonuclease/phosphatase family metal-dependent hydrolase [Sedimentibacter acidaminivorans]|uniref:Endonuclease/exonuclease/phosphatase family metal-dependent hydrolase n=1 Tax=Sedimentibacter acidaminivorans TaxID=913099 RepID=A0ABS4GHS7_9FIRM|nr:hypothetical protein [Sedimentibacter acidaminivorans]MBP1927167.1 endonuclease/exonuclease/phosphatase family metal-dependent hydrolase [Sedimentibacter acidaminivorans]